MQVSEAVCRSVCSVTDTDYPNQRPCLASAMLDVSSAMYGLGGREGDPSVADWADTYHSLPAQPGDSSLGRQITISHYLH